jgi:hypothetical protein
MKAMFVEFDPGRLWRTFEACAGGPASTRLRAGHPNPTDRVFGLLLNQRLGDAAKRFSTDLFGARSADNARPTGVRTARRGCATHSVAVACRPNPGG